MCMERKSIVYGVIPLAFLIVFVVTGLWYMQRGEAPQRQAYDELARCLGEKEAIFYGAFWCPACAQQKTLFEPAAKKLPYTECSTPDRTGQTEICDEKNIRSYPTWEFADGTRACGVAPPEVLAHLAGCAQPVYGEEEQTVQGLYKKLVEDRVKESLAVQNGTPGEVKERLTEAEQLINALMLLRHKTGLKDSNNVGHLLDAIYESSFRCAADEPEVIN